MHRHWICLWGQALQILNLHVLIGWDLAIRFCLTAFQKTRGSFSGENKTGFLKLCGSFSFYRVCGQRAITLWGYWPSCLITYWESVMSTSQGQRLWINSHIVPGKSSSFLGENKQVLASNQSRRWKCAGVNGSELSTTKWSAHRPCRLFFFSL